MSTVWDEAFDERRAEAMALGEQLLDLPEDEPKEPKITADLHAALYLGRLEETVTVYGHEFHLQTLTVGEELAVHQMIAKFRDSTPLAQGRAFATGMVAAAIVTVDGQAIYKPSGPRDNPLPKKWKYVTTLYWPVVDEIYKEYVGLERRQLKALEELKEISEEPDEPQG